MYSYIMSVGIAYRYVYIIIVQVYFNLFLNTREKTFYYNVYNKYILLYNYILILGNKPIVVFIISLIYSYLKHICNLFI